jgi:insulysin
MTTTSIFSWLSALSLTAFTLASADAGLQRYVHVEDKAQYQILTPALENRKVAKIQLQNGVQAYLISDPDIDQSAAAVSMQAGSWQDPIEYPGMAHFLEHMLFMGNAAYPQEFEYMQFINDNGGKVNAFTASDRTVYMFSINNEAYERALDRFSHFFIDPLFSTACINRELHAVDQEHSKNIENDLWREYMVFKETSNPDHPNAKFSTGNAETLGGIPQQALINWYKTHYGSDKLHLVMLSPLPIDQMIELAASKFSPVQKFESSQSTSFASAMCSADQKGHFIYIKPIKDLRVVSLAWELPQEFASIDEKWTSELVSYVLNQQSDQSLLKQLKRDKLAESLRASSDRYGHDNLLFRIDIQLTEQGISHLDTVIMRCFQAIARLKQTGVPLSLFEEMKTISQMNYQYQSREDAFDWITEVAYNLVDEDLSTFPEKTQIPSEYDPQSLLRFVDSLTPQTCLFFVLIDPNKTGIAMDRTEKWMQVEYSVKPIPNPKLAAWQHAIPHPDIQLPPANPFVSQSLQLVSELKQPSKEKPVPAVLVEEEKGKVYYAMDKQYLVPEASILFNIKTPILDGSAKSVVLMDLFNKALSEKLSSSLFFAQSAGISSSFSYSEMKFSIGVQGYSDKAPDVAKTIFAALQTTSCTADEFDIYKTSLMSSYANAAKELPVKQALETLSNILLNDSPTNAEKQKALESISYEDLLSFCKHWLHSVYLEGMIYGNLTQTQAQALWSDLKPLLSTSQPYLISEQKRRNVLILPSDKGPYKILQQTDRQGNGVVLLIQEGSFSFEKRSSQQLLSKALKEAFFETLRTKQQTAYIAQSWDSETERQLMQSFAVQSSSHSPEDLLMRFEMFLEDFNKRIVEIVSEDRFNNLKKMQITSLEIPPENMGAMADRLSTLAFEYDGDFSWIEKQIKALESLSYEQLLKDAHVFLSKENQRRLAILVEGMMPLEKQFQYEPIAKDEIRKVGTFVSYQ